MGNSSENKPIVLITGITGLIGTKLADAFASQYTVVGLDVKRSGHITTSFIECDLTEDASVTRALASVRDQHGTRLASVIHLAAYYDFSGKPSPMYQKLTADGTRRLLKALGEFQVEQFVFSSSLLVMEPAEKNEVILESSPTKASWDYPRSKLEAERVIQEERGSIAAVILRIAGVYNEDCNSIPLAQQISRIYEKKIESYFFPGDADHGQPFVHLDDLVVCFRKVVELRNKLELQELFLIAEPDVLSYKDLQDRLDELIHGEEWPTIRIPKPVAKAGAWVQEKMADEGEETFIKPWMIDLADADYPVLINRACQRLGWVPTRRLGSTLEEMIHRLKADPRGWYQANGLELPEEAAEPSVASKDMRAS
jgi:nucleoside-diphosphate-sugar epimerase